MGLPYAETISFVQHLAPTWRRESQETCAQVIGAFWERGGLCLSDLARAMPRADQSLHGRLKRLDRWLGNPHVEDLAPSPRWLRLAYEFAARVPTPPTDRPLFPVLVDTVYFEPFAVLMASVPCGSRGLPLVHTTYHRTQLAACFPPPASWPTPEGPLPPVLRRLRGLPAPPRAAARPVAFLSQNRIGEHLLALAFALVSPALRPVAVLDRGFARAGLFRWHRAWERDCVIRFDATTHVYLPGEQTSRPAHAALAVARGERRWVAGGAYQQDERVPLNLLAVWDPDQAEPWYLGTTLEAAAWAEACYRWRMRCECTHRDEKTGLLLRAGGDAHRLTNVLHLHRLVLALGLAEWLCALVGLQALRDLPDDAIPAPPLAMPATAAPAAPLAPPATTGTAPALPQRRQSVPLAWPPLEAAPPNVAADYPLLAPGPADPPPVVPHDHRRYRPPAWLRRFAGRGPLSYPRLGWEVLHAPDLRRIVRRLVHWVGIWLWLDQPHWQPWQVRYRLRHWWPDAEAA